MKRLLIWLFAIPLFATAQEKLYIQGSSPSLYLTHTIQPKENFYSIGRMYNISPKEIAPFNNIEIASGLSLGQTIKIPLTETNFSSTGTAGADEALVPLYHTVQEKEGLYHISVSYGKVGVETLKKWNHLSNDLAKGTDIIVGYLKVKKNLSSLASGTNAPIVEAVPNEPAVAAPVVNDPEPTVAETPKETPKKVIPKEVKPLPIEQQPVTLADTLAVADNKANLGEGAFKANYIAPLSKKKVSTETGTGSVFKSTSGWVDAKYYCLQNTAPSGTVIKITNITNGKSVYAKVLGAMPDIPQNNGLHVIVSNAAAEALGVSGDDFECTLEYSK